MTSPKFSIIVPVYNAEQWIVTGLQSIILSKKNGNIDAEILIIDDCSTDGTYELLKEFIRGLTDTTLLRTEYNGGPGAARNLGIQQAKGQWILFVDSDDQLHNEALNRIWNCATENSNNCDIIAFDWRYKAPINVDIKTSSGGRLDKRHFQQSKQGLLNSYLEMHMDHSVIYCAFRRKLLRDHSLYFSDGYHEDVDFLLRAFWHARSFKFLDDKLYLKNSREGSIVNTISPQHLKGFVRSYINIGEFLKETKELNTYALSFAKGIVALVATRAREIVRHCDTDNNRADLFLFLHKSIVESGLLSQTMPSICNHSLYSLIFNFFCRTMENTSLDLKDKEKEISAFIQQNSRKRWSCQYLHHSIYIRPNEINTCCKRFFVGNEIRGDVTILENGQIPENGKMAKEIISAKKRLFDSINKGEDTACSGCPFMEFKEWPSFEQPKITSISFEYHSVCNLICSYCSEKYYGGMKAQYDIEALVDELLHQNLLADNATIIWGGGEPVADKAFPRLITSILDTLPNSHHRVITNAVKFCKTTASLLAQSKVFIYSSVDAGSRDTYKLVRGKDHYIKQLTNLKKYADINSNNVFVKYIFTEGNKSIDEVEGFVKAAEAYDLFDCTFQISFDFKDEEVGTYDLALMALMYKRLLDSGCRLVFIDELIRQRVRGYDESKKQEFIRHLEQLGIDAFLFRPSIEKPVIVWGAGEQAKLLIENSLFLKPEHIEYFADSTPDKLGTTYFDREVLHPSNISESNLPVLIAATQNYTPIFNQFGELGIKDDRLIQKFII
jgi:glycosyltransferase involved in cell wall biosynthesis/organic radical activating enzyme